MCEIAVIDPERVPIQAAHQIAGKFHEEQGDGLGILAAKHGDGRFEYETYKSTEPHWQTVYAFMNRHYSNTWRFVIHGRAKTSGAVNRETSHPIRVDCDLCSFDYVVHNGHVKSYSDKQEKLIEQGHDLNTGVDTEVIAHTVQNLPDDVEDLRGSTHRIYGNLNYLLFSERGILVRAGERYGVTDDLTMTCSYDSFPDDSAEEYGFTPDPEIEWLIARPGEDEPVVTTKNRTVYTVGTDTGSSSATTGRASSSSRGWGSQQDYAQDNANPNTANGADYRTVENTRFASAFGHFKAEDDIVEIQYEDLARFDHLSVFKVAPGVLRMVDVSEQEENFIYRDTQPRLYYHYADEEAPDDLDGYAEEEVVPEEDEEFRGAIAHEVAEGMATSVAERVDEVDGEELQKIQKEVIASAEAGVEAKTRMEREEEANA